MSRIAIITGANKGIGLETTRALAQTGRFSKVYLTSRNTDNGLAALEEVRKTIQIPDMVDHHQLDITDRWSIDEFKDYIIDEYGGFDVLVNNAGILAKGKRKEKPLQTAKMMETNFWGTLNMMKAFYPIINENGRIVNVSGFVSVKAMNKMQLLSRQGKELHSINQSLSLARLEALAGEYQESANNGTLTEDGWLDDFMTNYATSKFFINGITRIYGREADMAGQGVLINSCCPGYTKSDMTGNAKDAPKLPSEAVKTSLWLATMADGSLGPQGCYLADA